MEKKIDLFVGIDPSINSTGVTILEYESCAVDSYVRFRSKMFYVIKDKLTKKENSIIENYKKLHSDFNAVVYDKCVQSVNSSSSENEVIKTINLINIVDEIKKILKLYIKKIKFDNSFDEIRCFVTIEANAYSAGGRTVSLIELAGLNYLIRSAILELLEKNNFIIYKKQKINVSFELIVEPPTVIKKFATTRGDADKELMLFCFKLKNVELFNTLGGFKLDDVADSYFMACYGLARTYKASLLDMYNLEQSESLSDELISFKENKKEIKITSKQKKQEKQTMINNLNVSDLEFINKI
jgi:hypothetical protein